MRRLFPAFPDGMIKAFTRKGVPEAKRLLFPNWLRWSSRNTEDQSPVSGREAEGRAFRDKFEIPVGAFLASYSGNLGRKQGFRNRRYGGGDFKAALSRWDGAFSAGSGFA